MNLNNIKPKNLKESDKYSVNLYKFIKKTGCNHVYININKGSFKEPNIIGFDWNKDNVMDYDIYVGSNIMDDIIYNEDNTKSLNIGQVIAKPLYSILNGNKLYQTGCYCAFGRTYVKRDFLDITDEFWKRYKEIGRCLFLSHDRSCLGDENRFTQINALYRKCNWCGKLQEKHIEEKIIKKEVWEDK